jgi:hypothetical protein
MREQPVHFGIAAGAQGTHPGLVGAPKLSSVVEPLASRPSAPQALGFDNQGERICERASGSVFIFGEKICEQGFSIVRSAG